MDRLNLLSPGVRANPYPYYAELRRSSPVAQVDPGGVWAVSRYEDVVAVLRRPAVFSSQGLRPLSLQPWITHNPLSDSLVVLDPPRHTGTRELLMHAFGARVLPRIEPLARAVCADFAARIEPGQEIDICQALSMTLPAAIIGDLLGLDPALGRRLRAWTDALVAVHPATPVTAQADIVHAVADMERRLQEVLDDRRRRRRDDLISDLLDASVDGQRLSDAELMSFLFLLLVAGFETTSHLITSSLRILSERPALLDRLRAAPASIPDFVEEALRFEPSVHGTMRIALSDAEIGGVALPRGAIVLVLLGSASRDELHFEDPDRFDMDRRQRASIPFGHGIHFCLGAALARAEVRIALEELLPRIGGIRVTREPAWNLSMTVRGPTSCWLAFSAAAAPSRR